MKKNSLKTYLKRVNQLTEELENIDDDILLKFVYFNHHLKTMDLQFHHQNHNYPYLISLTNFQVFRRILLIAKMHHY